MNHLEHPTKNRTGILALALAGALASTMALAANPHCIGDAEASQDDGTITLTATVSGLGNEPLDVVANARGTALVACVNPGVKRRKPPGLRRVITAEGSDTFDTDDNGNTRVRLTVESIDTDDLCPRPQRPVIEDVAFLALEATGFQDGVEVLQIDCEGGRLGNFDCECSGR